MRKTKFIEQQLRSLGFWHLSQNNIEKFKEMCNAKNASFLMDKLDNNTSQFTSTYGLFKEQIGKKPVDRKAPDTDDGTSSDDRDKEPTCGPPAKGPVVPIKVTVNGTTIDCNSNELCVDCKVHSIIMQAMNNLPPVSDDLIITPRDMGFSKANPPRDNNTEGGQPC